MSTKNNTRLPLLPVTLKEAALDSPTFRGTVVQCSEQVDHIEKWLDGYLRAATRLCEGASGLEELVNVFIQKSIPVNHLEVMLDYDYTHLAMRRFAEGSREYWNHVMGVVKRLENSVIEPLSQLQRGELRNFKEIRRQLETSQTKYDSLQSRYAAQSKSKDPSSLREDAFQLYEARKIYMKACFDFCVSAAIFRSSLDRTLTLVLTDQWREQNNLRNRGHVAMEKFNLEMSRVRVWSDTMESCERVLKKELILQRRAIEDQLKKDTQPARDLDEYSVSTVPFLTSKDMTISKTQGSERQGWLYMRSFTAKPTRAYWVRRWFFLKDGIFGYLMQGYRGGAVEESEKIGVLLCNVKAAFQEERRFCFEVKTKDTTILLQAETQADLTLWITTFEQAKRTAVNSNSIAAKASSIIPPSAPAPEVTAKDHFAHDENISMAFDRSLTLPLSGTPAEKGSGGVLGSRMTDGNNRKDRSLPPTPTAIGALMTSTHSSFPVVDLKFPGIPLSPLGYSGQSDDTNTQNIPKMTLAPNTLAGAPSPTSLMKSAAMTAALSTLESGPQPSLQKQMAQSKHKKTVSLDMDVAKERQKIQRPPTANVISEDEIYPPNYPQQLRAQDTQFRTLFPGEPVASPVLLVFLGTWHFTAKQEISGRFYITRKMIYFYAHSLGLVYKKVIPLNSIEEVRASPGSHTDHIVFHVRPKDPDDSDYEDGVGNENALKIFVNIFLEPVRLLQRRLDLLLRNEGVELSLKNTAEVLDRLVELETEPEGHNAPDSESWEEVSAGHGDGHEESRRIAVHRSHGRTIEAPVLKDPPARLTYPTEPVLFIPPSMDKMSLEKEFDLPAKALFHVMFGDKSVVFQRLYQGRRAQAIYQGPWFNLDRGKMKRDLTYEIEHHDIFRRTRRTTVVDYQTIEIKNDHLCYVITDCKTPWHLPLKDQFMLVTKLVITHVTKSKCKLAIWTAVEWSVNPKFSKGMIQRQALDDLDTDALQLVDVVQTQMRKLGTENRIKNAISLFGGIGENHQGGPDSLRDPGGDPSGHPNRQRVTQRSLFYMILENTISLGKSTLSTIVMSLIAVLTTIFGIVSAQRIILGLLVISAGSNMMLTSRSTMAYWAERRANRFLDHVGVQPNKMMSKAVYLKDMEELVANGTELALVPSSECYSKFRELASQVDYDAPAAYAIDGIGYKSASTRRTALNLMKTRQNLGTYRNDLLVALRLVNNMERNIIQSEWENWLIDEGLKCKQTSFMLQQKHAMEGAEDIESVARWVRDYCQSCEVERKEWLVNGKQLRFQ